MRFPGDGRWDGRRQSRQVLRSSDEGGDSRTRRHLPSRLRIPNLERAYPIASASAARPQPCPLWIEAPRIAVPSLTELQASASLYNQCFELREAEADALRDSASHLRRSLTTLHEQLSQRMPISSAAQCIGSAAGSLKTDLNQFFQNVELYRSGVFSHTTKESIATLGIGAKLDALEIEFTEADKEEFTVSASGDLFPGAQVLIDSGAARLNRASLRPVLRNR